MIEALIQRIQTQLRRIPLLDRWLLGELIGPLLFAIAMFTVLAITVGALFELVRLISEKNLPVLIAIQVLLQRLPSFLVLSFPMATLFATLLAYGRLSSNSELTALRSVGVTSTRMIIPALVLAFLMTNLTFLFNDVLVPRSNRLAEVTLSSALGRAISTEKGNNIIYPRFGRVQEPDGSSSKGLLQLFYAGKFEDGIMTRVTLLDFSRVGFTQMLLAERGQWNEQEAKWEFLNGQILTLTPSGSTTSADFDRYLYPLSAAPIRIAQLPKDARNMTVAEALQAEQLLQNSGDLKGARKLQVRIQEKFTFPMACLVFGLIGASLGSKPNNRTNRGQGFALSIVMILTYYLLASSFSALGVKGTLTPILAAWSPILICLGGGGFLLRQASR
ncbi:putative permease YjgP/YjgQ family protein [Synechococcus sp. MIT S9509]|uniref:LptF/LptG family permease n=1 Tax=unclassified Synechococcus TaxID=2626047 RepID=UPI0007BBFF28|nr:MULTISPECIES: LptF/LptG family permease [unclassified Synechococcus]KZR87245.1 putative permease YjgP/YjgQ family protein [Synechococcus sp. MIT S9504]KZR92647.1 putative permease YjgP/YjgQ family protein [Synechococcus sp. MIT S9509]